MTQKMSNRNTCSQHTKSRMMCNDSTYFRHAFVPLSVRFKSEQRMKFLSSRSDQLFFFYAPHGSLLPVDTEAPPRYLVPLLSLFSPSPVAPGDLSLQRITQHSVATATAAACWLGGAPHGDRGFAPRRAEARGSAP
jgi:hypothetical protein